MKNKSTIVLGAGFAGLSAAVALSKNGFDVKLIEKKSSPGGIGSEILNNGYRYEMGAHLFHCPDEKILNLIKDISGEDLIPIERKIKIKFNGGYYNFPLKLTEVLYNLPLKTVILAFLSFSYHQVKNFVKPAKINNSEDFLIKNYGKVLYEIFFESYIKHFWGIGPKMFSPKFAEQRIPNLNVIEVFDKMINSIKKILRINRELKTDNYVEKVEGDLYTTTKGFSGIANKMVDRIISSGGQIIYNSNVTNININNSGRIESVNYVENGVENTIKAHAVISTIPLNSIASIIKPKSFVHNLSKLSNQLKYRSLIFVGLTINKTNALPANLTYYRDLFFNRLTDISSMGVKPKSDGTSSIVAEVTCSHNDKVWTDFDYVKNRVVQELENEKIINFSDIIDIHVFRLKHAYPVYSNGFDEILKNIFLKMDKIPNLTSIGRQGKFQYINSHIAIKYGIDAADEIINLYSKNK